MTLFRSILYEVFQAISLLITGVVALPTLLLGQNAARATTKFWVRLALSGLRVITGIRTQIENPENIPDYGCVVASNHQSTWETLALYALLPNPVMIFKRELLMVPIFGWWLAAGGNLSIDRKSGVRAIRAMQARAREAVANGEQVVVFPEGTRVAPGKTAPLQSGIAGIYAATNSVCIPVVHNSGSYWHHPGIIKKAGAITLRFDKPIEPNLKKREFLSLLKQRIDSARPDLDRESTISIPDDAIASRA